MKTFWTFSMYCMFLLVLAPSLSAENGKDRWVYKAVDAPYGYSDGEVVFSQKEKTIFAEITVGTMKYSPVKVTKKGDDYLFSIYVDGTDISVKFKPESKDRCVGKASFDYTDIDVTLKRAKK